MALVLKLQWQGHNTKGPFAVFGEIPCCSRHIISQALRSWCEACGAILLNSLCRFCLTSIVDHLEHSHSVVPQCGSL